MSRTGGQPPSPVQPGVLRRRRACHGDRGVREAGPTSLSDGTVLEKGWSPELSLGSSLQGWRLLRAP